MKSISDLSRQMVNTSALDLLEEPQISQTYQIANRVLDICGAMVGLAVLALLLPIIALWILLEDRGPIFYKQTRVGRYGMAFHIYKFRTMIQDADAHLVQNPELLEAWRKSGKLQEDPRITRVGSFLRHTSIDELPQMFNVLRGEMSLVGPRPIQFSEVAAFGELFELRQLVKPGVTGLWQVSVRSRADYKQRCILDCTYVMDQSLRMDLAILLKTIPVVLHGIGAY